MRACPILRASPMPRARKYLREALDYMGIAPGTKLTDIAVDRVFIGSCTNARIEDLRAAAAVLAGRVSKVPGLVSPGSSQVKRQAEEEGLDRIFRDAGLEWADSGCSMCVGINGDLVAAGRTLRLDHQPQFPRPPGARRAHASDVAGHGRRRSGQRPSRRCAADARRAETLEGRMEKFVRLTAKACPLTLPNLNTDQILPARYLKWPRSRGLGTVLFQDLRFATDGAERQDFPLNKPIQRDAKILIAGRNFGGGSSREAAVYALYDHGIRCVIAPSFGDIFAQNAVKNGLLTAVVSEAEVAELAASVAANPERPITVDLEAQTITCGNSSYAFAIDPVSRNQLLNGWDDVDLTESYHEQISAFRDEDCARRPWAAPASDR